MEEKFYFLILGIIIPIIIQIVVFPFLPKSIQNFATYQKKRILKIIKQSEIKMELIVKSEKYDGVSTRETITELIKNKLSPKFTVSSTNLNLVVKVPIGNNEIEITIIPMHDVEDENMRFESLECRITASCRFSKFSDRVGNFREAQRKIEHVLKDTEVPRFKEEISLICKLKSLNEITGILKNTNFELLSAELDNGKQFELTKDKIIIYDKDINDEMISLAKKMIVMYD